MTKLNGHKAPVHLMLRIVDNGKERAKFSLGSS